MNGKSGRLAGLARVGIAVTMLAGGCKSSPTQYSSPRITGTVLDAKTQRPIEDVRVRRLGSPQVMDPNMPPRGGQVLAGESTVLTSREGIFVVPSVADLSVFRKVFWYTVSVSFDRTGYDPLVVTYTPAQATNSAAGEPVVDGGNIFLQPKSR